MTTPETPAAPDVNQQFSQFTGTRPVAPQHAFDVDRLAAWLQAHMPALAAGPLPTASAM